MDLPLAPVAPGVLQAPVPEVAGRFTIQVEQAEDYREGAPPLPWRVDMRLASDALADYRAAHGDPAPERPPAGVEAHLRERGHAFLLSSPQVDEPETQAWHRAVGFRECGIIAGINDGGIGEGFFRKEL